MKRSFVVALALATALMVQAGPASAHRAPNSCGHQKGEGAGWYRAYGHDVGCSKTREVARTWSRKCLRHECRAGEPVKVYVWPGYTCEHKQWGYESVRVECTAEGNRTVHFLWGS